MYVTAADLDNRGEKVYISNTLLADPSPEHLIGDTYSRVYEGFKIPYTVGLGPLVAEDADDKGRLLIPRSYSNPATRKALPRPLLN